jgi:Subtilase family
MALRFFAIGALAAYTAAAASSAISPPRPNALHPAVAPGHAHLMAVGSRSAAQRRSTSAAKMDSILADLSRHAALARPGHLLEDLHSLSPAARFAQPSAKARPLVAIDAVTRGDPQELRSALVGLGLQRAALYSNDVGGWLPVDQLEAAAARSELVAIRAAMPRTRTAGPVAIQGDYAQASSVIRADYPGLTGAGVTVGVLSDSFNCYAVYAAPGSGVPVSGNQGYASNGFTADYATDVSTGALPSGVNVLAEPLTSVPSATGDCLAYHPPTQPPFGDEGRAMLQIVHAVAPGAGLAFYTADDSEADFAAGIGALAAAGATVIADDVGYFDEPFYQDGIVAQAVNTAVAHGVAYFSAAGNNGTLAYENTAPSFTAVSSSGSNSGEHLLNFDRTGATDTPALPVSVPAIPPGDSIAVVVEWDQPYLTGAPGSPGATSSIDLCISGGTGSDTITDYDGNAASCTGPNAIGADPYQIMIISNPANAAGNTKPQNFNVVVGLANNAKGTVIPDRIIVSIEDDGLGSAITSFATNSATIQGHPGAAGAAAVGAAFYFDTPACGTTPAALETFSSAGGTPILFDQTGARLAVPIVRQKPDFVGPDGVNDTFLGFTLASAGITGSNGLLNTTTSECQNNPGYPNFFGTSAAAPHAAGIAALMRQANSAVTPAQIYGSLRSSALPMSGAIPNFDSGYGFIQADRALVVPALTLTASSIPLGTSATLTWSSIDATSCTASGAWTGAQASSGSVVVTPTSAGSQTYTLTCANANASGIGAASSVTLTATSGAPPAAPTLSLGSPSLAVGKSTTLSWSSTGATSCTASGDWNGTLAVSGSQTITPSSVGTEVFSLTCSNLGGNSPTSSVTLIATPALVAPPAPVVTLGASSIPADTTTTLSWTSQNATACTTSGNTNALHSGWSAGSIAPSGTFSITPTLLGTFTYTFYCSNAAGNSPQVTATLTVTASRNTGGGGTLDWLALGGLAIAAWLRRSRLRATGLPACFP